jgi:hypothetical protein
MDSWIFTEYGASNRSFVGGRQEIRSIRRIDPGAANFPESDEITLRNDDHGPRSWVRQAVNNDGISRSKVSYKRQGIVHLCLVTGSAMPTSQLIGSIR